MASNQNENYLSEAISEFIAPPSSNCILKTLYFHKIQKTFSVVKSKPQLIHIFLHGKGLISILQFTSLVHCLNMGIIEDVPNLLLSTLNGNLYAIPLNEETFRKNKKPKTLPFHHFLNSELSQFIIKHNIIAQKIEYLHNNTFSMLTHSHSTQLFQYSSFGWTFIECPHLDGIGATCGLFFSIRSQNNLQFDYNNSISFNFANALFGSNIAISGQSIYLQGDMDGKIRFATFVEDNIKNVISKENILIDIGKSIHHILLLANTLMVVSFNSVWIYFLFKNRLYSRQFQLCSSAIDQICAVQDHFFFLSNHDCYQGYLISNNDNSDYFTKVQIHHLTFMDQVFSMAHLSSSLLLLSSKGLLQSYTLQTLSPLIYSEQQGQYQIKKYVEEIQLVSQKLVDLKQEINQLDQLLLNYQSLFFLLSKNHSQSNLSINISCHTTTTTGLYGSNNLSIQIELINNSQIPLPPYITSLSIHLLYHHGDIHQVEIYSLPIQVPVIDRYTDSILTSLPYYDLSIKIFLDVDIINIKQYKKSSTSPPLQLNNPYISTNSPVLNSSTYLLLSQKIDILDVCSIIPYSINSSFDSSIQEPRNHTPCLPMGLHWHSTLLHFINTSRNIPSSIEESSHFLSPSPFFFIFPLDDSPFYLTKDLLTHILSKSSDENHSKMFQNGSETNILLSITQERHEGDSICHHCSIPQRNFLVKILPKKWKFNETLPPLDSYYLTLQCVCPSLLLLYRSAILKRLIPFFKKKKIDSISTDMIASYHSHISSFIMSLTSLQSIYDSILSIISQAESLKSAPIGYETSSAHLNQSYRSLMIQTLLNYCKLRQISIPL